MNMNLQKSKFKNVVLSMENYLKLKTLGHAGDSFNDVITDLLAEHNGENRLDTQGFPAKSSPESLPKSKGGIKFR